MNEVYHLKYTNPELFRAEKGNIVAKALEKIKLNGFNAELKCWDNAHILATSKSGKKMSYYALTGTIAGYDGSDIHGVDNLIELLKEM
ncbi:MAG: hypothetical protein KBT46_00710 [Ruminococcus sp.]|nr:hypothetical protein [Candidatus Copronaster equi]